MKPRSKEEHIFKKEDFCVIRPETVSVLADNTDAALNVFAQVLDCYAAPVIVDATVIKDEVNLSIVLQKAQMGQYPLVKIVHSLSETEVGKDVDRHNTSSDELINKLTAGCEAVTKAKTKHKDLPYYEKHAFTEKERYNFHIMFKFDFTSMSLLFLRKLCFSLDDKLSGREVSLFKSPTQKEVVWSTNKKRALLESILMGYPVGAFYINNSFSGRTQFLWDGRQRISAVNDFLFGEFPASTEFGDLYYQQAYDFFNDRLVRYNVMIGTTNFTSVDEVVRARNAINGVSALEEKSPQVNTENTKVTRRFVSIYEDGDWLEW